MMPLSEFDYTLKKSVVFVGMMGCGKTAVGQIVARHVGVPFIDTDTEIETAERMSIVELFRSRGEAYFRHRESVALQEALDGPVRAIALGGGGFLFENNRQIIGKCGFSVWLDADADLLRERTRKKATRPLLQTGNPYQTLVDLLAQRTPDYRKADIRVKSEHGLSKEKMAEKVIKCIIAEPRIEKFLVRRPRP